MANLRLISTTVIDSTHISARFTSSLNRALSTSNILIVSETGGVEDPIVLDVSVLTDTLTITCEPLLAQAEYTITFLSTNNIQFNSLNADSSLPNDQVANRTSIIGPIDEANPVKDSIQTLFANNVYDLDPGTIVSKYVDAISLALSKTLYTIGQTKSDNYLSFLVQDEVKTRGMGPTDRLVEEGAYEILRVGLTPTSTLTQGNIEVDSFPDYLFSLLATEFSESLKTSNDDISGFFNLTTFTLNLSKSPVSKMTSLTFIYNSSNKPYTYSIEIMGYQIQDSRYDSNFAFTYLPLNKNQIKISSSILSDPYFSLENIASVNVNYEYKNQGLIIDQNSLFIYSNLSSGRETLPPLENIFNLKNAPIVESDGTPGVVGDVLFSDPNAVPGSNSRHPAFLYEIIFRFSQLPSRPGEYAIDYSTGNVYVYGADQNQTGTGNYPPLAIYNYKHIYKENIDYTYDSDPRDLAALPNGNLTNISATISFDFELTLVPDIDYVANVHQESLQERIENRITALNTIQPINYPITNVFRIYNETTGEIYPLQRWNDQNVFFTYQTPPAIEGIIGEKISFDLVGNETLFVSNIIPVDSYKQIFVMDLENNKIVSNSEDGVGRPGNSSVFFSELQIFISEHYWDSTSNQTQNFTQLSSLGDYQIDYFNGVVYVLVSTSQELSVGTISYKRSYIKTNQIHLTSVQDIYFKLTTVGQTSKPITYINFSDSLVLPSSLEMTDEQYLSPGLPYQVFENSIGVLENGNFVPGIKDSIKFLRGIFEREDFINNTSPINFSSVATYNGNIITINPIQFQEYQTVKMDGDGYYISTNNNLEYLSPVITKTITVKRLSDSLPLWNSSGNITTGSPFLLRLPGINNPQIGQSVLINYSFIINDLSRVIVDYSRGDFLIDYSYLADEILLSYEYGDNVLNFAKSISVSPGDNYYVSYRAGALRDALLRNFGTLIDISILNNLNVDFGRERYRDALMAAMQSFTTGPTVASLTNIVKEITHSQPEVIESSLLSWTLGTSLLSTEKIKTTGFPNFLPGKHGTGIILSNPNDSLSFPISSNLKLQSGTMEMWITPQWNGIDNQADLICNITSDEEPIISEQIFIGPQEDHPILNGTQFVIQNPGDYLLGKPNLNKSGIFLYLIPDPSGLFNRWECDIVSSDGYEQLKIEITTHGAFYDVKKTINSITNYGSLMSGTNKMSYVIPDGVVANEGFTFTADYEHYLFDFGDNYADTYTPIRLGALVVTNENDILTETSDPITTETNEDLLV